MALGGAGGGGGTLATITGYLSTAGSTITSLGGSALSSVGSFFASAKGGIVSVGGFLLASKTAVYTLTTYRLVTLVLKKFYFQQPLTRMEIIELAAAGIGVAGMAADGLIRLMGNSGRVLSTIEIAGGIARGTGIPVAIFARSTDLFDKEANTWLGILYLASGAFGMAGALDVSLLPQVLSATEAANVSSIILDSQSIIESLGLSRARDAAFDHLNTMAMTPEQLEAAADALEIIWRHEPIVRHLSDAFRRHIPERYHNDFPFCNYQCPLTNTPIRYCAGLPGITDLYEKQALIDELNRDGGRFQGRFTVADVIDNPTPAVQTAINAHVRAVINAHARQINEIYPQRIGICRQRATQLRAEAAQQAATAAPRVRPRAGIAHSHAN